MAERLASVTTECRRIGAIFDDPTTRPAVAAIMERHGFTANSLVGPSKEVAEQVRRLSAQLLVFDLASGGGRGLAILDDLRAAVPSCSVVILSPFDSLRQVAVEAGAYEMVPKEDLRDLARTLRRLQAELEARDCDASAAPGRRVFGDAGP